MPLPLSLRRVSVLLLTVAAWPAQSAVLINELDADQTGTDAVEFVELYNDAATPASLDGHVLVFFNGSNDLSYAAFDLDGAVIAPGGLYTLGAAGIAGVDRVFPGATDQLQNGQDAVALYLGNASDFPNSTPIRTSGLLDAVVYDTDDADDAVLLTLLNAGQPQLNENQGGNGITFSLQRQPDGAGGARNTTGFIVALPTPDASNGGAPPPPPPAEVRRIHEIQGAQHRSPLEGQRVRTRGIVTSLFALSDSNKGFYLQDPDGDGVDATSEGLLVFVGSAPMPAIAVGDEVSVEGSVTEFRPGGATTANLSTTELTSPVVTRETSTVFTRTLSATVIGAGGRMPPTQVIDDDSTGGDVELAEQTLFDPASDGVDFYESLEGMWVRINDGLVTGPTNGFGEIFVVPDGGIGATGLNRRGGITLIAGAGGAVDYNPERLQIDDDYFRATGGDMPAAKVGDRVPQAEGVISYNFGNFELLPSTPVTVVDGGLQREVAGVARGGDRLSIANYNVENLDLNDDDLCNGSDLDNDVADGRFEAVAQQVVQNLGSPDVLALQEVQDDSGCTNDGTVVATQTLARLADAIVAAGGPVYTAIEIAPVNNAEGGQPSGNIRVAYLYNAARVSLVPGTLGAGGSQDATQPVLDANGELALSHSPGRIDPLNPAWDATRVSLAALFEFNGRRVLTINNHWSSKGGSSPILGRVQPFQNGSEAERLAQATTVKTFVDAVLAAEPDAAIAVLGDLNEFGFNAPLRRLTGEDAGAVVLTDLADVLVAEPAERYSYVFEGNAQALDHILVSDALRSPEVAPEFDAVHVNSEFPDQLSDHDPDIASFLLPVLPPPCEAGTVAFRREAQAVTEGLGARATAVLERVGGTCGPVSVAYATVAGTATPGVDYTSVAGTLNWADGDSGNRRIEVSLLDDATDETAEDFFVALSAPTGGVAVDTSTQFRALVRDDDPTPVLSLSGDQEVQEGEVDVTTRFSLDRPSDREVVATLTLGGTALRGSDYRFNTRLTLRIPAGAVSADKVLNSVDADIVDDLVAEGPETLIIGVSRVIGATLGAPASSTITILDND